MGEYKEITTLPKEFKTLEIDIDNRVFKLNGDDLQNCTEIDIVIRPTNSSVILTVGIEVVFKNYPRFGA